MLIQDFDEGDARRSIASDWESDARGKPSLDRQAFEDALFETVDLYTPGIGAAECASMPHRRTALHSAVCFRCNPTRFTYRYLCCRYAAFLWSLLWWVTGCEPPLEPGTGLLCLERLSFNSRLGGGGGNDAALGGKERSCKRMGERHKRRKAAGMIQARIRGKHAREARERRNKARAARSQAPLSSCSSPPPLIVLPLISRDETRRGRLLRSRRACEAKKHARSAGRLHGRR